MIVRRLLFGLLVGIVAGIGDAGSLGAQAIAPDAEWFTLETEHFRISFSAGLEPLARRAATRAESAYALLAATFVPPPRGRIELVLGDNTDFSNGFASPFPRNRIVLYAHPPADEPTLAFHTDWLEILILHELVHTFQMDHAGRIWNPLRSIFGRNPALFPNLFTPGWLIEGLATYFESEYTGAGRVHGSMYEMVLRTAILEDAFFSLDRASLDPVTWPGPSTRYIYGALFIDHLARRFGPSTIADFVTRIGAGLVPYRLDAAAREAFGTDLESAWREWQSELRMTYTALAERIARGTITEPELLTHTGEHAYFPRFSPDGRAITFAESTGREEAAQRILEEGAPERTLVPRSRTTPAAWLPDGAGLLYSQLDFDGPYRILSDLHRADLEGTEHRLTRGARVWGADPHPDGDQLVAIFSAPGTNRLGILQLASGELDFLTEPDFDLYWSSPRWSPTGDRIAVSRWRTPGLFDVVILDGAGHLLHEVTTDRATDAHPAWSPDGRYLLFSSDRTGIPNLFAFDTRTEALWQVTNVLTGAFQPDISPDGESIVFSYYRSDGYHIARIPFVPGEWSPAPEPIPRFGPLPLDGGAQPERDRQSPSREGADREGRAGSEGAGWPLDGAESQQRSGPGEWGREHLGSPGESAIESAPVRPYSALATLLPTSWGASALHSPDRGWAFATILSGQDAIARHLWSARAIGYLEGPRIDGGGAYSYRGWGNPVLDLEFSQEGRFLADRSGGRMEGDIAASEPGAGGEGAAQPGPESGAQIAASTEAGRILRRDREAALNLSWLHPRWRSSVRMHTGLDLRSVDLLRTERSSDPLPAYPLEVGGSLGVSYSSQRSFEYSLGAQQGIAASALVQARRSLGAELESAPREYWRLVTRARAFRAVPNQAFAPAVLAARLDAAVEGSSGAPGFLLGGVGGVIPPLLPGERLGSTDLPVRGYPVGARHGNRVVHGSFEYRFPIALIERGAGVLPFGVRRLWADLFTDTGMTWCSGACLLGPGAFLPRAGSAPLLSIGAELMLDLRLGYFVELPLRAGLALPLTEVASHQPQLYLRLGPAF